MTLEEVRKLQPVARLIYWISERHQIYLRRAAGKSKPWTDDPILQSVYFTNPYRENDKVTAWVRRNIREPLGDDPAVVFAVVAFRWFNLPRTGEALLDGPPPDWSAPGNLLRNWDTAEAVHRLETMRGRGETVFTGAYNISNGGSTKPKINRVCEDYVAPAWERCGPGGDLLQDILRGAYERRITLEGVHDLLGTLPGMGGSGFMAGQIIADLKYTPLLRHAPDWWTWCCLGPGSRRGLNIVLGRPVDSPPPKNWLEEINRLRLEIPKRLRVPPMHAQDMQSCLCEVSKYHRVLHGGGSKRRYNGAN